MGCYRSISDGVSYSGLSDGVVTSLGSGSATIAANDSYVTVTHGLGRVPQVIVSPKDANGINNYISNVGNTTFRINNQVPQPGDAVFDYLAT